MAVPPQDSEFGLALPAQVRGDRAVNPSPLEEQVIALFDLLRDRVLRYVLSLGLSVQDAEEINQEVFLALFQHLRRGKPDKNLQGWVFRVAHNLALKQRQSSRRVQDLRGPEESSVDPEPSPEARLADRQRRTRLQAVLAALPEQDQRCLALRAEGLRYREIAEILGISLGAVSNSLARSLARLSRADGR